VLNPQYDRWRTALNGYCGRPASKAIVFLWRGGNPFAAGGRNVHESQYRGVFIDRTEHVCYPLEKSTGMTATEA
jgi:hypothetical protein